MTEGYPQPGCGDGGMLLWMRLPCLEIRYWQHPQRPLFSGLASRTCGQSGEGTAEGCFPSSGPASSTGSCLVTTGLCLSLVTSLSLTLILILTPTCRLTLQLDLRPASSPQLARGPNSRLNLVTISGPAANLHQPFW